jgi:hypothetical protein
MKLSLDELGQAFRVIREALLYRLKAFRRAEGKSDTGLMRNLAGDLVVLEKYHEGVTAELHARFGVTPVMAEYLGETPITKQTEAKRNFRIWQTLYRLRKGLS